MRNQQLEVYQCEVVKAGYKWSDAAVEIGRGERIRASGGVKPTPDFESGRFSSSEVFLHDPLRLPIVRGALSAGEIDFLTGCVRRRDGERIA